MPRFNIIAVYRIQRFHILDAEDEVEAEEIVRGIMPDDADIEHIEIDEVDFFHEEN